MTEYGLPKVTNDLIQVKKTNFHCISQQAMLIIHNFHCASLAMLFCSILRPLALAIFSL